MRIMINEISKKAGKYLDYAVELLKELIAHKSVAAEAQEGMPYGRDCADCLAFAEDFLKKEGYIVRNFDNHAIISAAEMRSLAYFVTLTWFQPTDRSGPPTHLSPR